MYVYMYVCVIFMIYYTLLYTQSLKDRCTGELTRASTGLFPNSPDVRGHRHSHSASVHRPGLCQRAARERGIGIRIENGCGSLCGDSDEGVDVLTNYMY